MCFIMIYNKKMKEPEIKENPFHQIYIDLTSTCNLNCPWCCNRQHVIPDISLNRFEEICKTLPERTEMRFAGGEPALHPKLLDLMDIAKGYGHFLTLITNTVEFNDIEFCKKVKTHGPVVVSLSMDSLTSDSTKLNALENLVDTGFHRLVLTATLTGENTDIIQWLRELYEYYKPVKYIHFRNIINEDNALTFSEMVDQVAEIFPEWENPHRIVRDGKEHNGKKCCGYCQLRQITPDLRMLILDARRASNCHLRGYINNKDMTVNTFFNEIRGRS